MPPFGRSFSCTRRASVVALLVLCCSGTDPPAASRPYVGRLMLESSIAFPDGFPATLSPAERSAFSSAGIVIDEVNGELMYPRAPIPGRWMKIGDDFYKTDADGYFRAPAVPQDAATVLMYRQILDAHEEQTFTLDTKGLSARDDDAPIYLQSLHLASPTQMNLELPAKGMEGMTHAASASLPDACPTRCDAAAAPAVSNSAGCCQDYNGPYGDGLPRSRNASDRTCVVKAYGNFLWSTCAGWSFGPLGTACSNEAAFCAVLKNQPPWCASNLNTKPPFCFENHRYRNCQNMDESDFSVSPTAVTVARGGRVKIHVRNNTAANETSLNVSPDVGLLAVSTRGVPALTHLGSWRVLRHYSETARMHYEDVDLVYVAPPAKITCPSNCECKPGTATVTITASAGKLSVPIIITVDPAASAAHETSALAEAAGQCVPPAPLHGTWILSALVAPVTAVAPGGDEATGVSYCLAEAVRLAVVLDESASGVVTGTYSGSLLPSSRDLHTTWPPTLRGTVTGVRRERQLEFSFAGDFAAPAVLQHDDQYGLWWGYFTGGPDCIANATGHDFGPQEGLVYLAPRGNTSAP